MKRNALSEVEGYIEIAKMANKKELGVYKASTIASVYYTPVEMVRGDYETVKDWCIQHQNDTEFDDDYVSQYIITIAKEE